MDKQKRINIFAKTALFGAALIWGSSFFIVKNTVDVLPPNFLLAVRFSIGCLVLCLIFFKRLKQLNKSYLWQGAIIGFCLFCAYCSQTIGITDTTPGKNAFLTAVYCVIVPFLFWIISKKRPDFYNILAAVICITGIGLVSLQGDFSIRTGDALTLLGGFFYAAHMVCVAKFSKGKDPILITIMQFAYAAIFSWIVTLVFEPTPSQFNGDIILSILFLAVFCTAGALLLQNIGQKHTHPAAASIILSLESVFGVLFSVLLYGERLSGRLIVGFLLIFIAVIISETKLSFLRRKKAPSEDLEISTQNNSF